MGILFEPKERTSVSSMSTYATTSLAEFIVSHRSVAFHLGQVRVVVEARRSKGIGCTVLGAVGGKGHGQKTDSHVRRGNPIPTYGWRSLIERAALPFSHPPIPRSPRIHSATSQYR